MRLPAVAALRRLDSWSVDAALAVAMAVGGCVAGQQFHPEGFLRFDATAYLLTCVLSLPLAARRRAPLLVLIVSAAAYTVYLAIGYQPSLNFWAPMIALVTLAGQRPPRVTAVGAVLTMGVSGYSGYEGGLSAALVVAQGLVIPLVAVVLGGTVRRLALTNRQLVVLTARLEREQEERARRAIVDERVRIARELHDVVAHHMSVITVQVGLASYVFTSDPPTARAALDTIGAVGREALDEMRRLLSVLRVDTDGEDCEDEPAGPAPGLDQLAELAVRMNAAGVPVDLRTDGVPRHLPPGLELCVYRIVQEALTNVVKHAGPARAEVRVHHWPDRLSVSIVNDVADRPFTRVEDAAAVGTGHGLIGMRERAKLFGGTLIAEARPEGGFRVRLTLPTGPEDPVPPNSA